MASRLQIPSDDSILLRVTHSNLKNLVSEVRFSPKMTVESAKEKLWRKCGTSVNSMKLELYDDTGVKVCDLDDNFIPLGFYSPLDGYRLHIIDLDPSSVTSGGWLEDTSLVEKYTISESSEQEQLNYLQNESSDLESEQACHCSYSPNDYQTSSSSDYHSLLLVLWVFSSFE